MGSLEDYCVKSTPKIMKKMVVKILILCIEKKCRSVKIMVEKKYSKVICSRCGEEVTIPAKIYFEYVLVRELKFICHECRGKNEPNFV